jgi:hypothetical protein
MFGLEYLLAFIKVMFQIAFAIISAIPFRIAWNAVIPVYFAEYIPKQLYHIPYWHFVGIILVSMFLGEVISRLTPKIISFHSTSESKVSKEI